MSDQEFHRDKVDRERSQNRSDLSYVKGEIALDNIDWSRE